MAAEDAGRSNPDELLKAIQREDSAKMRGHLKIFFGYAAGVGKTYAMLRAAQAAKTRGVDVVVGYVEPHARPQTTAQLRGLKRIPTRSVSHGDITLQEFDLDATIARAPQLVLVDELAHTNAPGSRHAKRYQDVEELLKAGIDVYTTVNVQHIESLNDMVASITGVIVRERIPDRVFDDADQVTLVDIEPADLIDRLNSGQVYQERQAGRALTNFFTVENLTALREIALRRCADRVNRLSDEARAKSNREYYTDEHILVCVSPSPSNPKSVRTAARMAHAFHATFTALYVETPAMHDMGEEDRERLRQNINLAEQLGAKIETVNGDDVAFQIAEFARLSGVSKVVLGRSTLGRRSPFHRAPLTERLIELSPNLDVYIIPDTTKHVDITDPTRRHRLGPITHRMTWRDTWITVALMAASTAASSIGDLYGLSDASAIAIYMLGTQLTGIITLSRVYPIVASTAAVLLFNFFFVEPRFTFMAFDPAYIPTFIIMFVTALLASMLTARLARHAEQSAHTAFRMRVLLETNQMLQQATGSGEIVDAAGRQLVKLLGRDVVIYLPQGEYVDEPRTFTRDGSPIDAACVSENERATAQWVFKNNKHAGASTSTLPNSHCLYLAIRINDAVYGVAGIVLRGHRALDASESSMVLSILGECALALESDRAATQREEAAVLAKNEQLRANLLRSISHDLRTPLTAISGAADVLLCDGDKLDAERRQQLCRDIRTDSQWLISLVENLLSVTRIEDGTTDISMEAELVDDVVNEAVSHVTRTAQETEHKLVVQPHDELLLARMDAPLIVQVLVNLIDNAFKYTPRGSTVTVDAQRRDDRVMIQVADDGPGIPDEDKGHIFDMFYTGHTARPADGMRSLGFGLALCKSVIAAHGGTIEVLDNYPRGCIMRFYLPVEDVPGAPTGNAGTEAARGADASEA